MKDRINDLVRQKSLEQFRKKLEKDGGFSIKVGAPDFIKATVDTLELLGEIALKCMDDDGTRHFVKVEK